MPRPNYQHLDSDELDALASSHPDEQQREFLSSAEVCEAEAHVVACTDCASKVAQYRALLTSRSRRNSIQSISDTSCQYGEGVDWNEVVAGQWPELKARQLMTHAALCDDCGPLLRTATRVRRSAEQLVTKAEQVSKIAHVSAPPRRPPWLSAKRLIPALAILLLVSVISFVPFSSTAVSGDGFAVFAAQTHQQHEGGNLGLEIRSESAGTLNTWFKDNLQFPLTLPVSKAAAPDRAEPQFVGARRVAVEGKPAVYVAYRSESGPASLIVTTDSVAVAKGGSVADYKKVSFHYSMVDGYKVVTWSQHGLTYALVSHEGVDSQQSCMVCHSAMHDRDLARTPTPLHKNRNSVERLLQQL